MMTPDQWFTAYSKCHQHPINKIIHCFAVPLIFISIAGLLWDIPRPSFFEFVPLLNWASVSLIFVMLFYFRLSVSLGIGMLIFSVLTLLLIALFDSLQIGPTWLASLILFGIMWVFQFIGHAIEGQKPAFFDDLKFLLIGPLWLLGFIYRRLGVPY